MRREAEGVRPSASRHCHRCLNSTPWRQNGRENWRRRFPTPTASVPRDVVALCTHSCRVHIDRRIGEAGTEVIEDYKPSRASQSVKLICLQWRRRLLLRACVRAKLMAGNQPSSYACSGAGVCYPSVLRRKINGRCSCFRTTEQKLRTRSMPLIFVDRK